jgi:DMSO reductase anchor subunit
MVKYIPIATTILSIVFFIRILMHYRSKPNAKYLLWWTLGVLTFGMGTITESIQAIFGWSEFNTRVWYIVGALLGGFPLAQGTVYLFLKRRTANILTIIFVSLILIDSVLILMTPITIPAGFDYRLTGKVFDWHFVRYFSPLINMYSLIFLAGGACYSAYKYYKLGKSHARFLGNIFISVGALLPGIGGSFTRFGHVEVLFITEFLGLACIYYGYIIMKNDKTPSFQSQHANA